MYLYNVVCTVKDYILFCIVLSVTHLVSNCAYIVGGPF